MASGRNIRAGGAYVELSLRNHAFIKGLRGALGQLKAFGVSMQAVGAGIQTAGMRLSMLGAGIVVPLLLAARAFATMGSELYDMSGRTKASVESLSEIGYAAKQTGAEIADVEIGIKKMQKALAGASEGDKGPAKAISDLGLNLKELLSLSPDAQLEAIGDRITAIENPALQSAAAIEMFGRSGTNLLPMLANLSALRSEARSKGFVFTAEEAASAKKLSDAITSMKFSVDRIVATIGGALAPSLTEFADKLVEIAGSARKWIDENKGLIISLLLIGSAAVAGGILLAVFGGIISAIATGFVVFATVAGAALTFLMSPIGMTIAAIVGIGGTILWATGAGGDALDWLGEKFAILKDFALKSFKGIADALAAGDVALAAKVLWASVKVVWQSAINTLKGWWLDFKGWFIDLSNTIFWGGVAAAVKAFSWLKATWQNVLNEMAGFLRAFATTAMNTWDAITGGVAKQINNMRAGKGLAGALALVASPIGATMLFDKDLNAEDANKEIDAQNKRSAEARDKEDLSVRVAGDEQLKKDLAVIDKKEKAALAAIVSIATAEKAANDAQGAADKKAAEAALAAAKAEWEAATKLAKDRKLEADGAPGRRPRLRPPDTDDIDNQIRKTIDVSGTFNAAAISRMGVGDTAAEETAKNTKATADNTKKIWAKLGEKFFLSVA